MILIKNLNDISNEEIQSIVDSEYEYYIKVHNGEVIETNDSDKFDYYIEKQIIDYAICTSNSCLLEEAKKRNILKNENDLDIS